MTRLKIAVLSLIPDAGHVAPLLKIAEALAAYGHEVMCLLPDECSTLASTFAVANTPIGRALSPIAIKAQRGFGGRSIFAASLDVYYRDYYCAIFASLADMVATVLKELGSERPDLVLVDDHQFQEVSAGIGAELGVPIVFHDSVGGLHSRANSLCVNLYGKSMSRWRQLGILAVGSMYYLYCQAARSCRFRFEGLSRAAAGARADLGVLLTRLAPSAEAAHAPGGAGIVSAKSRRMKYHFATGLGLLEQRVRNLAPFPDRRVFGPIWSRPAAPLPSDLEVWLEGQPSRSVVFVSFGSMVTVSVRQVRMLLSSLNALGAPVLWASKSGRDAFSTQSLPERVRIETFVPQRSVLCHPAIGACVTHGGSGAVLECMVASVPMVVMPVMWDQPYNAQLVQELGAGIRIDWWRLTDRVLTEALRAVLLSPEYRQRLVSIVDELRAQRGSEEVLRFLEDVASSGDAESWIPES
jgi:UDP:flavonoid glycosyltransferase YjiC (YdhE family)